MENSNKNDSIIKISQIKTLEGRNIITAHINTLKEALEANPYNAFYKDARSGTFSKPIKISKYNCS